MLADRHYMREENDGSKWSPVKVLLVVTITLFFLQCILQVYFGRSLVKQFGLSLAGLESGAYWQFLTCQFLHSAPWPWHVIGNCIGIYFLGSAMQEVLTDKDFYKLYLGAGTMGGVLQLLATLILPNQEDLPMVGASAGVFGLMGAFATMFPEKELTLWLYFMPLQVRAKHLFWGFFGLSLFGTLFPYSNVADGAHLGGLLTGFAFIRLGLHERSFFSLIRSRRKREPDPQEHTLYRERSRKSVAKPVKTEDLTEDFISKDVDPILDKISSKGIHSLTDQERKILEKARAKMAKR
ncbi:MAG: Rhomboid family protein [Verrucomicrobia bacterium]|jgi:membrane associated rhomboid family serine protease|nr:Rhomboid family protein [Verrucomicrobiota bacterium]